MKVHSVLLKKGQDSALDQLMNRGDIQLTVRPVHGDDMDLVITENAVYCAD